MEISVLVSRSLFPVHPLCAGECILHFREEASTPPVSFQLCIPCFSNTKHLRMQSAVGKRYKRWSWPNSVASKPSTDLTIFASSGDVISIVYSIIALLASVFFVVVGVWYYVKQSHQQIQRLDQIDKARSFVGIQA